MKKSPKLTQTQIQEGKLVIEICEWMVANGGKTPSKKSTEPVEKKLGNRLVQLRQTKAGKFEEGKFKRFFKQSFQQIAEKYGVPDLFEMRDRQAQVEETVREIISWMKEHGGRTPNSKTKVDPVEKKLGEKLSSLRQTKKNNGHRVFYPTLQTIAEDAGFPELFESKTLTKSTETVKKSVTVVGAKKVAKEKVTSMSSKPKVKKSKTPEIA